MVPKVVGSNPIFHPNKRSKKMSQDIFLFFTPTRKPAYGRRCKEQNVLRSSLLRSAVWKRPRGERMGKTSKAKSIPSSTQYLRVSLLTGVGASPRNGARLKLYCYNVIKIWCGVAISRLNIVNLRQIENGKWAVVLNIAAYRAKRCCAAVRIMESIS